MKDLDTQLPELMTRAAEGLEPESVDLVERSVTQGLRARRRRAAGGGVAAGVAVLATMGVVFGGVQHFGRSGQGAPAGPLVVGPAVTPTPAATPTPPRPIASSISEPPYTPPPVNPKDPTLLTLRSLLEAPGRTFSVPDTWGSEADGFFGAGWVVDDGKGGSRVQVLLQNTGRPPSCATIPGCTKRPDGSTIRLQSLGPEYSDNRQAQFGILTNSVEVARKNGWEISVTSYNGVSEKGTKHTRATPILTAAQLTKLADKTAWKFPTTAMEK